MRILILTHTFNSLAQKIFAELKKDGHQLSVEYDISDQVTEDAVNKFKPDILIAPFLKRAIPASVFKKILCLIIHPGPPGDQGPSALDWAIINQEKIWGVTVIEANEILDGGPILGHHLFPLPKNKSKGAIYRQEIATAALKSLNQALSHLDDYKNKTWAPTILSPNNFINRPAIKQIERKINWELDSKEIIINKINSADGDPGVFTKIQDKKYYLYDAKIFPHHLVGDIATPLAISDHGIIINTINGPITIGHLKEKSNISDPAFKKAAHHFFPQLNFFNYRRVRLEIIDDTAWIYFNFYNGAMGIKECNDLKNIFIEAKKSTVRTIILKSENDFFSNGIHLNEIEAAQVPADYAYLNILAMNDLIYEILISTDHLTVAIMDGNASAGGVLLGRACDLVLATPQIILNPHYKNMGNLYGSEFWTYLLPKYLGLENTSEMMKNRLPLEATEAKKIGLIDEVFDSSVPNELSDYLKSKFSSIIKNKALNLQKDQELKPLKEYEREELLKMHENFYGLDPSFHLARYNFVRHVVKSKTPLHLALHRSKNFLS